MPLSEKFCAILNSSGMYSIAVFNSITRFVSSCALLLPCELSTAILDPGRISELDSNAMPFCSSVLPIEATWSDENKESALPNTSSRLDIDDDVVSIPSALPVNASPSENNGETAIALNISSRLLSSCSCCLSTTLQRASRSARKFPFKPAKNKLSSSFRLAKISQEGRIIQTSFPNCTVSFKNKPPMTTKSRECKLDLN
mmetsp:Transcript_117757/g.185125  ORF Transcript_117757/g.185125 Transcript_117757/m.185125 type:complete len:200 (+) Transcript_117757:241-840(+)